MKTLPIVLALALSACCTTKSKWVSDHKIGNKSYFLINGKYVPEKELDTKNNFKT